MIVSRKNISNSEKFLCVNIFNYNPARNRQPKSRGAHIAILKIVITCN